MILHIAERAQWAEALRLHVYRGDTLDTEGFIHCSEPRQVVDVANSLFRGRTDLVLLVIEPSLLHSELRYEVAPNGLQYPHIYGPLNPDAVSAIHDFSPGPDGRFTLPTAISPSQPA